MQNIYKFIASSCYTVLPFFLALVIVTLFGNGDVVTFLQHVNCLPEPTEAFVVLLLSKGQ